MGNKIDGMRDMIMAEVKTENEKMAEKMTEEVKESVHVAIMEQAEATRKMDSTMTGIIQDIGRNNESIINIAERVKELEEQKKGEKEKEHTGEGRREDAKDGTRKREEGREMDDAPEEEEDRDKKLEQIME